MSYGVEKWHKNSGFSEASCRVFQYDKFVVKNIYRFIGNEPMLLDVTFK